MNFTKKHKKNSCCCDFFKNFISRLRRWTILKWVELVSVKYVTFVKGYGETIGTAVLLLNRHNERSLKMLERSTWFHVGLLYQDMKLAGHLTSIKARIVSSYRLWQSDHALSPLYAWTLMKNSCHYTDNVKITSLLLVFISVIHMYQTI